MFVPFYSTAILALESYDIIGLRLAILMSGGRYPHDEAKLILSDKVNAML